MGLCIAPASRPMAVLDGALAAAHAPEDAAEDDRAGDVAHGPPNVVALSLLTWRLYARSACGACFDTAA